MARTKKSTQVPQSQAAQPNINLQTSASSADVLLSEKTVFDVLLFAKSLAEGMYPGIYTPDLMNARLKDISYAPTEASEDALNQALKDPKNSESELRSFIENFEIVSMPLRRILSYMGSHLAFDVTYTCTNAEVEDYKKPAFKKDKKQIDSFLDLFDYRAQFRNVVKQILRNEIYVCAVRDDTSDKIVLQELPLEYCKIVSKWGRGYLAAFNFLYFLKPGIDIRLYPKFFRDKFNELFDGKDPKTYNPAISIDQRGDSQYVYWVDLPPEVGWVFKFDPSIVTAVPYFTGLMKDLIDQNVMRSLQKNINLSAASRMVVGEVPMLSESKAQVKDMIAIDPTTLGKFLALVRSALSESIKVASAPLKNMQALSFDAEPEVYDKWMRSALASSGMNTALFYTSNLKANTIESQLSFQSDSLIMEHLYSQFNLFMDYFGNKRTSKYKYAMEFEGNDYYLDRKQRFDYVMALADKGIVLPQKIAAARGMKPQTLIRMMEESKAMGFTDMLTPILSSFQMSGKDQTNGRPSKSDSELTDSGAETRSAGSNLEKGGDM